MRFKTKRAIQAGDEITAYYADDYCKPATSDLFPSFGNSICFLLVGKNNRECLCETCEKLGRGGWTAAGPVEPSSPSSSEIHVGTASPDSVSEKRAKVTGRTLMIDSEDDDSEEESVNGRGGVSVLHSPS